MRSEIVLYIMVENVLGFIHSADGICEVSMSMQSRDHIDNLCIISVCIMHLFPVNTIKGLLKENVHINLINQWHLL